MKKEIIIINGSGGSGKDTFVEFCGKKVPVMNISSVDKIKEAGSVLGWDGGKKEEDRKFLSDLKILSTEYNDNPFEYIKLRVKEFIRHEAYRIMFIHIREPKEIERVKKEYGCKTLLVKNSKVKKIESNMADANVDKYKYDFTIYNNKTLKELETKAYEFVQKLLK